MKKKRKVLHVSTECYPMAKAGGMADVVGSLPVYQVEQQWEPSVITPKYDLPWYSNHTFQKVYKDSFEMEGRKYKFKILKAVDVDLAYDYYVVDIPELFMRPSIYLADNGHGYPDEAERNVGFQRAVLVSLERAGKAYDVVHCHDHQAGLIPFFMKHGHEFESLREVPTFYTIHNGAYNSRYPWSRRKLLPKFPKDLRQMLDWDGDIDVVASAMRYADHINAVSPTYLEELSLSLPPLQYMLEVQPEKFSGILNGIDDQVWDPATDPALDYSLRTSWDIFKSQNKGALLKDLYRADDVPLISFIGRFAHQKGADLLLPAMEHILTRFGFVNFFILGSGDPYMEERVREISARYKERVASYIGYDEVLAHKVYASSDFIVMPSRFEPCGLNQMFAMRYGALPMVRWTGGLKDTVVDFSQDGNGVTFEYDSVDSLTEAMARGLYLYKDQVQFKTVRDRGIETDHSWSLSAEKYINTYNHLINSK